MAEQGAPTLDSVPILDGAEYTPDPDKLRALADAMNRTDNAVKALIADELSSWLPSYEAAEVKAAERVHSRGLSRDMPAQAGG